MASLLVQLLTCGHTARIRVEKNRMTKAHAAGLQMKWKQRGDPLLCAHIFQEPAHTHSHFIAGLYYCIECGQELKRPPLVQSRRMTLPAKCLKEFRASRQRRGLPGLFDPALVLHSLRHGGITKLTSAGVPHNVCEMITGHSASGVHSQVRSQGQHTAESVAGWVGETHVSRSSEGARRLRSCLLFGTEAQLLPPDILDCHSLSFVPRSLSHYLS